MLCEKEGPGWTSVSKTIPELTAGLWYSKVELSAEKKLNNPQPYLNAVITASTLKCWATTSKQTKTSEIITHRIASKPAGKKGLLHRLLPVYLFFHTLHL